MFDVFKLKGCNKERQWDGEEARKTERNRERHYMCGLRERERE
jgi:hypothetical protein